VNREHKMSRADSLALESFCAIQIVERVYTIHSSMQYNSNHHDTKERVPSVFSTIYAIPIPTMPLASILISVKKQLQAHLLEPVKQALPQISFDAVQVVYPIEDH